MPQAFSACATSGRVNKASAGIESSVSLVSEGKFAVIASLLKAEAMTSH
jgi:hypothetical protein